ncbi:MAG TPA: ATP-binding protein, partial [Gemmataceae bacterium]|nr:ATP-binding protein [Gemmataceae bacterium]
IGMSRMLSTEHFGQLNAKQADYLHDITAAGEHLLTLINDILDLSKVEAGRMELAPEPVSIAAALETVLATVRPLAEAKGLRLTSEELQPDSVLSADPARFRQILLNLLSNAVKFTPAGGRVTVRCFWTESVGPQAELVQAPESAGAVRFDIEDTGIGIDPRDHDRIGHEFYQGRRSRGQAAEGTGLGLALTRRLVDLMGGAFWFRSVLGEGSCFSFALPLHHVRMSERSEEWQVTVPGERPA